MLDIFDISSTSCQQQKKTKLAKGTYERMNKCTNKRIIQ